MPIDSVRIDDWFLTAQQRGNPATRLDSRRADGLAWSTGNEVTPLIHGAAYFAELLARIPAMAPGDLLLFTDWRGDPDERLGPGGPSVSEVLGEAAGRGVIVRGLIWRSHWDRIQFSGEENRHLGEEVVAAGGQCLLDMRVRAGGSHHMKLVVLRHPGRPELDAAFVGGIDLCHSRRDQAAHEGDQQRQPMAAVYGERPPWHDVQAMIRGPAVGDVEAVFRERWDDPVPITLNPFSRLHDLLDRQDDSANRLPAQQPDPPPRGSHAVQLVRTYPFRRPGYSFAPRGERSIARAYLKVLARAQSLIYLEDQYLWSDEVVGVLARALADRPALRLIAVIPRFPDQDGALAIPPNLIGRIDALRLLRRAGGDRVAVYGLENEAGTPVYVHAKVCVVDDTWAIIGSDNFNRRSWTHDSELSAAVLDLAGLDDPGGGAGPGGGGTLELPAADAAGAGNGEPGRDPVRVPAPDLSRWTADYVTGSALVSGPAAAATRGPAASGGPAQAREAAAASTVTTGEEGFARALRLRLSGEHLSADLDPDASHADAYCAFWRSASDLDAWHAGGRHGPRPPGRLRHYQAPHLSRWQRLTARPLYRLVYDPDGRPPGMRRRGEF